MDATELLAALKVAERLKDTTRHCYTSGGRHESVAEHSWMMTLTAFLLRSEFPEADMDRVLRMCVIHDLGECFTGDIPTFEKERAQEETEETLLMGWVDSLPGDAGAEMRELYREMEERRSTEARIYKAIDSLEALIQHNLSDLSTWTEQEKDFNLHYADDRVTFSEYFTELRQAIRQETERKLQEEHT